MAGLSRAETQVRNRAKVLSAARDEFARRGFRDAKIDVIAERAELTRGAVYSNFPGKRALYFAVLADLAEHAPRPATPPSHPSASDALAAFARAWVARLPWPPTATARTPGSPATCCRRSSPTSTPAGRSRSSCGSTRSCSASPSNASALADAWCASPKPR